MASAIASGKPDAGRVPRRGASPPRATMSSEAHSEPIPLPRARAGASRAGGCARASSGARSMSSFSSSLTRRIVVAQSRRPAGPGRRLPAAQPVPRRHHRRANAEPEDPGRHHRRRDRRLGRGRHRHDHRRSGKAAAARARRERRAAAPSDEDSIEFSINPERVGPVLHRLVTPTRTRARIYDRDGLLLLDSQHAVGARRRAARRAGEPRRRPAVVAAAVERRCAASFAPAKKRRAAEELDRPTASRCPRSPTALPGKTASAVRVDAAGETIVSVAVPIQRAAARSAARCCSRPRAATSIRSSPRERWALLRFFLVLAAVMLMLSLSLANTIAEPVRKLAEAAERVRRGIKIAPADPRLHQPLRRDRPSLGRAARHDPGALQPHRRDRELRRRRRARTQESADLAAQRGGDPAAGEIRPVARSSARRSCSTTCAASTG